MEFGRLVGKYFIVFGAGFSGKSLQFRSGERHRFAEFVTTACANSAFLVLKIRIPQTKIQEKHK